MKNLPMLRSWKSAVVCVLLCAACCFACGSAYGGMGVVTLAMLCVLAMPLFLCLSCALGGLLPAMASLLILTITLDITGGAACAVIGCVYMSSVLAMFLLCQIKQIPFVRAILCMAIAHLTLILAIIVGLQLWAKGNLYALSADAAVEWMKQNLTDTDLFTLSQMLYMARALPRLKADAGVISQGAFIFEEAARTEWLNQVRMFIESYLQAFASGALVSTTVMSGLFSLAYPTWRGRLAYQRRAARGLARPGEPEPPLLKMPPFSKWHLPRGIGLRVGILALGGLLTVSNMAYGARMAGSILYAVFKSIYGIQGACTLDFILRKRDMRRFTRRLIVVALYLVLPDALTILGVLDQLGNLRKLRPPRNAEARP